MYKLGLIGILGRGNTRGKGRKEIFNEKTPDFYLFLFFILLTPDF